MIDLPERVNIAMKNIREQIDMELSSVTFESIEREFPEELPVRKENNMKISRKFAAIGIAAAAAACLTVTVGAMNDWDYGRVLRTLFPDASEQQQEVVSEYVIPVTDECVTSTLENYDVSIEGMVFDGSDLVLSMTLSGRDGTVFEKGNYYGFKDHTCVSGFESAVTELLVNDDGTLSARYHMQLRNCLIDGQSVTLKFDELYTRVRNGETEWGEPVMLDSGSLMITVSPENKYEARRFTLTDGEGKSMDMVITPLSIKIYSPELANELVGEPEYIEKIGGYSSVKTFYGLSSMAERFEIYNEEGDTVLDADRMNGCLVIADVGLGKAIAAIGFSEYTPEDKGTVYIRLSEPFDADAAARVVLNDYEYNG